MTDRPADVNMLTNELRAAMKVATDSNPIICLANDAIGCGSGRGMRSWVRRAFALGAEEVVFTDLGAIDGRLTRTFGGGYRIEVNSRTPHTRQLFSLGHEIAHILLERVLPSLSADSKERSLFHSDYDHAEEFLADQLSAEMLMPRTEFDEILHESSSNFEAVISSCRAFGVSISAANRRMRDLDCVAPEIIEFVFNEIEGKLNYRSGRYWKLPFLFSVDSHWTVSLTNTKLNPRSRNVQWAVLDIDSTVGVIESFNTELCWMNSRRVVGAF